MHLKLNFITLIIQLILSHFLSKTCLLKATPPSTVWMYHRQQNTLYPQRWQILRRNFLVLSRFMLC